MTRILIRAAFLWTALLPSLQSADVSPASRWWEPCSSDEVDGAHVLGFWRFDKADAPGLDSSSHQLSGELKGAKWHEEGRFGGSMESSVGHPVEDVRHALVIPRSDAINPNGSFTLEMWLRAKSGEDFPAKSQPVLADSKYTRDTDGGFQWGLSPARADGSRRFMLEVGLGDRTERWSSEPVALPAEEWFHVAVSYDAQGTAAFWLDGKSIGRETKVADGMAPSTRGLSLGDRLGSTYHGFPGWIDEVRLTEGVRQFLPLRFQRVSRRVFHRMDENAGLAVEVENISSGKLDPSGVTVALPGNVVEQFALPALEPGASHTLEIPLDARLRSGEYHAEIRVDVPGWGGGEKVHTDRVSLPFVLINRPLAHRMPVIMWGIGGNESPVKELPRLKELGFTHCLGLTSSIASVWRGEEIASSEDIRAGREMLDTALANGLGIVGTLSPGRFLKDSDVGAPFLRVDREGKPYQDKNISGLFPEIQQHFRKVGEAMGRGFGDHPAFDAVLVNTEIRDHTNLSFHPTEIEAVREATGRDIPDLAKTKRGVSYTELPDFPENRVIPDDDPLLSFYRWFWTKGDGWNELHTQLSEGLKATIPRDRFWTFFDPAVRVPSIAGSGGSVDVLSHWTYTYPDPVRIGLCTDELFAMARANGKDQDVMKMTQVIWYRSQTAPVAPAAEDAETSPWVDFDPDAAYITIAPMHLREALWLKLARPVTGIMYHGWQSLVPGSSHSAYTFTNSNAAPELKRLVKDVVEPLGPTLLQVPDPVGDVAFLESFTSQIFARRGTYGWGRGWAADLYQVAVGAQLQPRVVYEETLLAEGLDNVKVLVMGDCDVLTESVVDAVLAFQGNGGIVIGDDRLCPAISPDIKVPVYLRKRKAAEDKAHLAELSGKLRQDLSGAGYQWRLAAADTNVITRLRVSGSSDYVFAVNDRREAGNYVGAHGLVMENGLPTSSELALRRDGEAHVYDLVAGRTVDAEADDGIIRIPMDLGPCEGRLLLVTGQAIEKLSVEAPETVAPGQSLPVEIRITDRADRPVDAVVPVELTISDPEGRPSEVNGYYGAAGGMLQVTLDIAPNDSPGLWEIRVRERAGGNESRTYFRVGEAP